MKPIRRARDAKILGDPASPGFRVELSPFFQMNRTVGAYGLTMERALRAVGMDIPRWRVLMLAHERGPVSVGEIADGGVLKLSTATRVVQRLRDEGLVRLRRSSVDARVTEVQTTAAGRCQRSLPGRLRRPGWRGSRSPYQDPHPRSEEPPGGALARGPPGHYPGARQSTTQAEPDATTWPSPSAGASRWVRKKRALCCLAAKNSLSLVIRSHAMR